METINWRIPLVTAVAPLAWGTTYVVTQELLPADRPLFAALVRALPAGLLLLALRRRLPAGDWWWRSLALGVANIGLFFPLIFLAAYHLPGGLAATIQAASPLAVMAVAAAALHERAGALRVGGGLIGLVGVALLVLRSPDRVDPVGLLAAAGSVAISAVGFVLLKRWRPQEAGIDLLTLVSWQLVVGGIMLLPLALLVEGVPPAIDAPAVLGFLWLGLVGTALAYVCWFHGMTRMPAGAASLVGLLNPVVGVLLGVVVVGEVFGPLQALGLALVLAGVLSGQLSVPRRRTGTTAPPARRRVGVEMRGPLANRSRPGETGHVGGPGAVVPDEAPSPGSSPDRACGMRAAARAG